MNNSKQRNSFENDTEEPSDILSKKRGRADGEKESEFNDKNSKSKLKWDVLSRSPVGEIIINKKEVWNIIRCLNEENFKNFNEEASKESINDSESQKHDDDRIFKNSTFQIKMMIKRQASPSPEKNIEKIENNSPSNIKSLSNSILEVIKTESNQTCSPKQDILKRILGDHHHHQYTEIFKIFESEINNPASLDYFIKLKETLIKEETDVLINTMVFIVWSLRFMKVDSNFINDNKFSVININSFMLNGKLATENQERPLNFFTEESSFHFSNASKNEDANQLENNNPIFSPNFTFNNGYNSLSFNSNQLENANKEEEKTLNKSKSDNTNQNKESIIMEETKKKSTNDNIPNNSFPLLTDSANSHSSIVFNSPPNGVYIMPFSLPYFPSMMGNSPLNFMIPINPVNITKNTFFNQPTNLNAMIPNYSSNLSSFYPTELAKTEQIKINTDDGNIHLQTINHNNHFTPNYMNNIVYNSLSSICNSENNNPQQMLDSVKKESDMIDIAETEEKKEGEYFESVFREILTLFSNPISEQTFKSMEKFMNESKVRNIEKAIRQNPFSYLQKKKYLLLFRGFKEELYLKIDPHEKRYSIIRSPVSLPSSKVII